MQRPTIPEIEGIRLDHFEVGVEYEVGSTIGALLLAEGWAEPVPLDTPPPARPFDPEEPLDPGKLLQRRRDLVRQLHPPAAGRAKAADNSTKSGRR